MLRYIDYQAELHTVILVAEVDGAKPQPSVPHRRDWGDGFVIGDAPAAYAGILREMRVHGCHED